MALDLAGILTKNNITLLDFVQDSLGYGDFERILSFDSILTLSKDSQN